MILSDGSRFWLCTAILAWGLGGPSNNTAAQEGDLNRGGGAGGRSGRMFRWLDRNENGVLEGDELRQVPPLKEFLERRGLDLDRGVSPLEFADLNREFRQEMQQPGDPEPLARRPDHAGEENSAVEVTSTFRRRGPDGGGDLDAYLETGRDRFVGRRGFASPEFRPDFSSEPEASEAPAAASPAAAKLAPRTVTVVRHQTQKLPEEYRSKDLNGDGQIGLYEWPRRDLANFRKLDLNGDGFIVPEELLWGRTKSASAAAGSGAASMETGSSNAGTREAVPTGTAAVAASPAVSAGSSPAAARKGAHEAAELAFRLLDKDKDGKVSEEEWGRSLSVRPKFERAGIAPSLPLNKDDVIKLYQKLDAAPKS